jgi:hypothetical protein
MRRFIQWSVFVAYGLSLACGVNWVLWGFRWIDNVMVPVRTTAACGGVWFLCFMFEAWWNDRTPFKELP